jgi:hypothetical protein
MELSLRRRCTNIINGEYSISHPKGAESHTHRERERRMGNNSISTSSDTFHSLSQSFSQYNKRRCSEEEEAVRRY